MRRPRVWIWAILGVLLALTVVEYLALTWVIPRYAVHVIRQTLSDAVTVGSARLQFPFTLVLTDVRLDHEWPLAGFYAKRVVIKPAWLSWRRGTVSLGAVDVEQPWVRLSRTKEGRLVWPAASTHPEKPASTVPAPSGVDAPTAASVPESRWRVSVRALSVVDGTIAFLDEQINRPFYGVLDHISAAVGPVTWPPTPDAMSLAVHGEIVGHAGNAAPIYCSGWLNPIARNLEMSCQLEPLALAAFEPYYYQGRLQARVYKATLDSTSHWSAKGNELEGRIQLTIDNLDEGDLSIRGSTLMDIKQLAAGASPTLTGQVKVSGPLDDPTQWQWELVPGNEIVQRLMKPLLDRGREVIRVRLGGEMIKVGISAATEDEMSEIEEASKQVEASLEILTTPLAEEMAAAVIEQPPVLEEELPASAEAPSARPEAPSAEPSGEAPQPSSSPPAESTSTPPTPPEAPVASE